MLTLKGTRLVVEETGQQFKSLDTAAAKPYIGIYHEQVGNFMIGKGQVFAWLYTSPSAIKKLSTGEYDLVMFPPGRSITMAFRSSPLKDIWKPSKRRGHAELLALISGWVYEEQGVPTLLIRVMSTRKSYRRNGLLTQLIKSLQFDFPNHALVFEDLTDEGYQFVRATFPEAGHVWTAGTWRPKGYQQLVAA